MPFVVERLDSVWHERPVYGNLDDRIKRPPSSYIPRRVYGCVFDDLIGLQISDRLGIDQIMFETDYPHGDSTWPNSKTCFSASSTKPDWTSARRTCSCAATRSSATACSGSASSE